MLCSEASSHPDPEQRKRAVAELAAFVRKHDLMTERRDVIARYIEGRFKRGRGQGLWGIWEMAIARLVIATITALVILLTGVLETGIRERYGPATPH